MIELVASSVVVVALVAITSLVALVRTKSRRQESSFPNPTLQSLSADTAFDNRWQYVATTIGGNYGGRVWAYGLWQRGWCRPTIADDELLIERRGANSLVIPIACIRRVSLSSATIGRGVEPGGLLAIDWEVAGQSLTTCLRAISPSAQNEFVATLESKVV